MLSLSPSDSQTIAATVAALHRGERTCVDVVEECLAACDAWESKVHAWVSLDREGALRRARELDAERAAGRPLGPLFGIPLSIKDLVDVAGWPTGAGSAMRSQEVVHDDAVIVRRLREAGAILMGKTVTTQFACFDPPVTRNPWNLDRTPGGSSSGSAAAVATGMCLGAIGSQTGGSITRPASFCGVAGCKPSYGRVPVEGVYPVAPSLDHPGPIARTVGDLALLLAVMADSAASAPVQGARSLAPLPPEFATALSRYAIAPKSSTKVKPPITVRGLSEAMGRPASKLLAALARTGKLYTINSSLDAISVLALGREIGVDVQIAPRLGRLRGHFESAEPEMLSTCEMALAQFSSAGATVVESNLPASFADVIRSHRVVMVSEIAAHHERRLAAHPDDYLPGIRGLIEEGLRTGAAEYVRCRQHQARLQNEIGASFEGVDVLACPASFGPAPDTSTTGDPAFNSPWSYTRLPTVSFPIGLSRDGLPLAIQLVGRHGDEATLFAAAAWCENAVRNTAG